MKVPVRENEDGGEERGLKTFLEKQKENGV